MGKIFVISDTHFGHANILKFTDKKGNYFRGDLFKSVSDMDEFMIRQWNEVVSPGDKVYHLGDVFFGDPEEFKKLWPRLNGSKRLIVGNHDDIRFLSNGGFFKKVYAWRKLPEHNVILTHFPIDMSTEDRYKNIHGHIHQNKSPSKKHFCVSVEQINYQPVELEKVAKKLHG